MPRRYLDWAATAPPYPDIAIESARLSLERFGNPSSAHSSGRDARSTLESARSDLAAAIGCAPERLAFTSGGTEADSIALLQLLARPARGTLVVSGIEHSAVWEQAKFLESAGFRLRIVKPGADGLVSPSAVADAIDEGTALVAVMAVNNETGAIQPIKAISEAVALASAGFQRRPFLFCDCVQALGKLPINLTDLGVDGASFSAHKLGGPRGAGALYLRKGVDTAARGGGQEGGIRPGTQNVAGAWAFAAAAKRSVEDLPRALSSARAIEKALLDGVRSIPGAVAIPGDRRPADPRYSPFIVSLAFPGLGGEVLVRALDSAGIEISTGSACSGPAKTRRVLDAMGLRPELAFGAVRVSIGRDSCVADAEAFLDAASSAYSSYRM